MNKSIAVRAKMEPHAASFTVAGRSREIIEFTRANHDYPKAEPQRPKKNLAELFAESPFKGLEIDFERDPDYGRTIEL